MSLLILADDHPLFRRALKGAIAEALPDTEIEETESLGGVLAVLARDSHLVDAIVLDLTLRDCCGLAGLVALRTEYPEAPVVVVSADEDRDTVRRAMAAGAAGFVPKSAPPGEIGEALRAVLDGDVWAPSMQAFETTEDEVVITPAQHRILRALQQGSSNKQIAFEMGVTESTVKAHMSALFRRLGVANRTQALLVAQARGVLPER